MWFKDGKCLEFQNCGKVQSRFASHWPEITIRELSLLSLVCLGTLCPSSRLIIQNINLKPNVVTSVTYK